MKQLGTIEVGPFALGSRSGRSKQVFLVTPEGRRLLLRRYEGPSLGDRVLEKMAGDVVAAEGIQRGDLFIATSLDRIAPTEPLWERVLSTRRGRGPRTG